MGADSRLDPPGSAFSDAPGVLYRQLLISEVIEIGTYSISLGNAPSSLGHFFLAGASRWRARCSPCMRWTAKSPGSIGICQLWAAYNFNHTCHDAQYFRSTPRNQTHKQYESDSQTSMNQHDDPFENCTRYRDQWTSTTTS